MTDNAVKSVEGGCLCGAIRFAIRLPTLWCAHCHCSMCRRAHGAGFVTWVGVADAAFAFTGDVRHLSDYASSDAAVRSFCSRCGTPFLFRSSRWPGETHVAMACLDGPIDRLPETHAYADDHVPWIALEGLPVTRQSGDRT